MKGNRLSMFVGRAGGPIRVGPPHLSHSDNATQAYTQATRAAAPIVFQVGEIVLFRLNPISTVLAAFFQGKTFHARDEIHERRACETRPEF